jgi:hypothetical protein
MFLPPVLSLLLLRVYSAWLLRVVLIRTRTQQSTVSIEYLREQVFTLEVRGVRLVWGFIATGIDQCCCHSELDSEYRQLEMIDGA